LAIPYPVKDLHLLFFASFAWRTRLWVIRDRAIQPQRCPLSVVTPIADIRGCGWIVRYVPLATIHGMSPD